LLKSLNINIEIAKKRDKHNGAMLCITVLRWLKEFLYWSHFLGKCCTWNKIGLKFRNDMKA
jgi:hypothetical protein